MSQSRDPLGAAILLGLVRASPILLLGGLYLYARESLLARFAMLEWFAPPVFLISAGYIVARTVVRRRHILPTRRGDASAPATQDAEPAFDADAAIKRYLDRKGEQPVPEQPVDFASAPPVSTHEPAAPRPVFGRKVVR